MCDLALTIVEVFRRSDSQFKDELQEFIQQLEQLDFVQKIQEIRHEDKEECDMCCSQKNREQTLRKL